MALLPEQPRITIEYKGKTITFVAVEKALFNTKEHFLGYRLELVVEGYIEKKDLQTAKEMFQ